MVLLSQALRLGGLLPPHSAFQGHATHLMRWPMRLSPNGSRGTCIPQGLATFLHTACTAHRSHATASLDGLSSRQTTTSHPSRLRPLAQYPRQSAPGSVSVATRYSLTQAPLLSS